MLHPQPMPWHEPWYGNSHGSLVLLLLILVLAGVVIWLVVRVHGLESTVRSIGTSAQAPVAAAPVVAGAPLVDPAVAEARMRFARGELDRDAYLIIAQDLGASTPEPPAAPPSETPPTA